MESHPNTIKEDSTSCEYDPTVPHFGQAFNYFKLFGSQFEYVGTQWSTGSPRYPQRVYNASTTESGK
jgi:hypothetical protein